MKEIEFEREIEIKELYEKRINNKIKVVIGPRRAGKSYLLNTLFKNYLITKKKIESKDIKIIDLQGEYNYVRDEHSFKKLLNNLNNKYIFIDEVQLAGPNYYEVLISYYLNHKNTKIYVTGSNSKILSDDIRKSFKEYGETIYLRPLSYKSIKKTLKDFTIKDYFTYGGLPLILKLPKKDRIKELNNLFKETYLVDIQERFKTIFLSNQEKKNIIKTIVQNMMNPISEINIYKGIVDNSKLSEKDKMILKKEIKDFIDTITSSFLLIDFDDGKTYNPKTPKNYINHNIKKYCYDLGILNIIFDNNLENKKNSALVENAVFLKLHSEDIDSKGIKIDRNNGKKGNIDFCCNINGNINYIQTAFKITDNNYDREINNLSFSPDNVSKVLVLYDKNIINAIPNNIKVYSIEEFLSK